MKAIPYSVFPALVILCIGCAKEAKTPEPTPAPATVNFSWTPSGGQAFQAEDAYYVAQFSNIVATKAGGAQFVDITLTELKTGTYSLSPNTGNTLQYSSGTATLNAKSGQVVISSAADNKLTGNFSANFDSGSGLTGSFKDVPSK
jgi:hypothetical protein